MKTEGQCIATRCFRAEDQEAFAAFSGDWNPMHMNALAARRTAAGAPVVHGIHLLLWIMESVAALLGPDLRPISIKARFTKWVYIGDTAELVLNRHTDGEINLSIILNGLKVSSVRFATAEAGFSITPLRSPEAIPNDGVIVPQVKEIIEFADLRQATGFVTLASQPHEAARLFPAASAWVGALALAELACSTRLVGMRCPGLHSVFAELRVELTKPQDRAPGLSYQVTEVDERFRSVKMSIEGASLRGTVDAFARVPPVSQASMAQLADQVQPHQFAGTHALIVGGSRGLGEFCAKALAAGGANVTITYAVGLAEAERVAAEIRDGGGTCNMLRYDAREAGGNQLEHLDSPVTHLYYFASTTIARAKGRILERPLFLEFADIYLYGFFKTCAALRQIFAQESGLCAFFPSTVYIDNRPEAMTEYAMVKAAGEILCEDLPRLIPGTRVVMRRLPRMLTDQTASLLPVKESSVAEVMLPILREVQATR